MYRISIYSCSCHCMYLLCSLVSQAQFTNKGSEDKPNIVYTLEVPVSMYQLMH